MKKIFNLKKYFLITPIFFLCFFILPQKVFADVLNQEQTFFVEPDYDISKKEKVAAVLKEIGTHGYFYVDEKYWNERTSAEQNVLKNYLENLSAEFDRTIYPKLRKIFGKEWSPGIDNDSKITIFLVQMSNDVKGAFRLKDEYPKTIPECQTSNEREMVYLNVDFLNSPLMKSFLAHEFQHLITWNQKYRIQEKAEDIWLNEARSEYAPTLCGYDENYKGSNLQMRASSFMFKPSDPLCEWQNDVYDYGPASLFIHYLVDHFGEEILKKMIQSDQVGIASINRALEKMGYDEKFEDIFTNWTIANLLNDFSIDPSKKYGYLSDNLNYSAFHIDPQNEHSISLNTDLKISQQIKDWSGNWYKFNPLLVNSNNSTLRLIFDGQQENGNFRVPVVKAKKNNSFEIDEISLNKSQDGTVFIENFGGEISWAAINISNQYKKESFEDLNPSVNFSLSAKISPFLSNGSLIRQKGDYKVYITEGNYKRHILSGEIFNFYGHLNWDKIIEVSAEQKKSYTDSCLARVFKGEKVYEINGDGTKHWINMAAEQFQKTGRKWEMIYSVNQEEMDFYKSGEDVLYSPPFKGG
jgi:hypothetical protein